MIDFKNPEDPVANLKIYLVSYLNNVVSTKDPEKMLKMLEMQHTYLEQFRGICDVLCRVWETALEACKDDDEAVPAAAKLCLKFLLEDVQEYYDSFTE